VKSEVSVGKEGRVGDGYPLRGGGDDDTTVKVMVINTRRKCDGSVQEKRWRGGHAFI
jgi:hypothetical protein